MEYEIKIREIYNIVSEVIKIKISKEDMMRYINNLKND
jgi:hypothetical protein